MTHYAFLDENNIVLEVIVGKSNDGLIDWESQYSAIRGKICKRTSQHTNGGVHNLGGTPFRKNFAGIGFTYDVDRDAFIAPKPYPSWILNEDTCRWEPPTPYPADYNPVAYEWNEETQTWQSRESE